MNETGNQFSQGNNSQFPPNFQQFQSQQFTNPMMVNNFNQSNMMGSFLQNNNQNNPAMNLNQQIQSQDMAIQNQFNNNQQVNFNQIRNQSADWRSHLSATDRYHVINQLGRAVHQALAGAPQQTGPKVDNLARGLEQHIYETADSRVCIYIAFISLFSLPSSNLVKLCFALPYIQLIAKVIV
ncbi:hypothetical protein BC833DRAFT_24152 [Globomyces pollinis-pini]|nr:hypothetical protein BC833DRAFT_24152 [Globomyces pollinis-pini]